MLFLIFCILSGALAFGVLKLSSWELSTSVIVSIIMGVLNFWFALLGQPTIELSFLGTWALFLWPPVLAGFISIMEDEDNKQIWVSVIVIVIFIIVPISNSKMFNSTEFREMLSVETVPEEQLTKDLAPISNSKIRIVDEELAKLIAEKDLGQITSLGSRCKVGNMTEQKVTASFTIKDGRGKTHELNFKDDFLWVGPLEFTGYFKQSRFQATDGYVIVSATNPDLHYLVTEVDGRKMELRFLEDGYFDRNLKRQIRNSGFTNYGLTEESFEIDESGIPHWIVTAYKHQIGTSAPDAVAIIDVDPINGNSYFFELDEILSFVDRVHPEKFIKNQIDNWGELVNDYINPSNEGVITSTLGTELVFNDSVTAYYTGMQSVGADKGTNGFILVDSKTKKAILYTISGANEEAVKMAAEQAKGVKEAGYTATDPKLLNARGIMTYFMTLKSIDGQVKMYAFVNLKNYQTMGVGTSLREASMNYQNSLAENSSGFVLDAVSQANFVDALIKEIVREGSNYYLILNDYDYEFYGSSIAHKELKWAKPGDEIKILFNVGEKEKSLPIIKFDLLRMDLQ